MKILLFIIATFIFALWIVDLRDDPPDLDPETGLIIDPGYKTVDAYCIGCHTGKMIIEHRSTRNEWQFTVQKMQKIAGQWTLDSKTKKIILDYLSKNYPRQPGCCVI